nr:uncharacterized protein LOC127294812 isoform X2 [Lolium perenne]
MSEWESDPEAPNLLPISDDDDEDVVEEVTSEQGTAAALYGFHGVISVLFETPSGFAILGYDAAKLPEPEAWKHIWADFVNVPKAIVWLRAFQPFEDKLHAINAAHVCEELDSMLKKHVVKGQLLAVGKQVYKTAIEEHVGINCLYSLPVRELMWGLEIQMRRFVPEEKSELANEGFQMSKGMGDLLNRYNFEVNLNMVVTKRIIEMAGIVYECDRCVDKHNNSLRSVAKHLLIISGVETKNWDLLKLATALKIVCYPKEKIPDARQLFPKQLLKTLKKDAHRYKNKILKLPCLEVYKEIHNACKIRLEAEEVLDRLITQVKKAHEAEQASKAASDHQIGHGINPAKIAELTECHTMLSANRKERQISSYPLNMTISPGILSMDIHPLKFGTIA